MRVDSVYQYYFSGVSEVYGWSCSRCRCYPVIMHVNPTVKRSRAAMLECIHVDRGRLWYGRLGEKAIALNAWFKTNITPDSLNNYLGIELKYL